MIENVHFFLLGGIEIRKGEQLLTKFVSAKAQALLVYLAVEQRTHTRERLAGLFWGDVPEADAKTSLRSALSNLRKLAGDSLEITRHTAAIVPERITVDSVSFAQRNRVFLSQTEARKHKNPVSELETLSNLYKGDFLAGFSVDGVQAFDEWMLLQREQLRVQGLAVLQRLAEEQRLALDSEGAQTTLARLIVLDPLREGAYRALMRLLAHEGQYEAALERYEQCRAVLAEELGVDPTPAMVELADRVHIARDLVRNTVPVAASPLIGRRSLVQKARLALRRSRIVTLAGTGGCGKTRLSLAVGSAEKHSSLDGTFFIPLAAVNDTSGVITAIAGALGIQFRAAGDPLERLIDALREREVLLILDNLEHLMSAETVRLIVDLVEKTEGVRLLITSRERLRVRAETVIGLRGLVETAAVDLFRERAGLESDEGVVAVEEICRMVEGLPLAVELAAALAWDAEPDELAGQLRENFDALAGALHDLPPRQRSLRAVFVYSWRLLRDTERDALARLGVFRGVFSAEAARSVAETTPSVLHNLVAKSLVRSEGDNLFSLHEAIRQYAVEQLEDVATVRDRHALWHGVRYDKLEGDLRSPRDDVAAAELDRTMDDARTAFEWAIERRLFVPLLGMLPPMTSWLDRRGLYREGLERVGRLRTVVDSAELQHSDDALQRRLAAFVLYLEAFMAERLGRYAPAEATLQQALMITETLQPVDLHAMVLSHMGLLMFQMNRFDEANHFLHQVTAMEDAIEDKRIVAISLSRIGTVASQSDDPATTLAATRRSVAIQEEMGNERGLAIARNGLVSIYLAQGNVVEAERLLVQNIALCKRIGEHFGTTISLYHLGTLRMRQDRLGEARVLLQDAISRSRNVDDNRVPMMVTTRLATVAEKEGDLSDAAIRYRSALEMCREQGDAYGLSIITHGMGRVALLRGDLVSAESHLAQSLIVAQKIQAVPLILDALFSYAKLQLALGKVKRAADMISAVENHPAVAWDLSKSAENLRTEHNLPTRPIDLQTILDTLPPPKTHPTHR